MTDFKELPVYRHKQVILDALAANQVIVVESPTGSGKTTQIPLILKEAGYAEGGVIGITQPRRIATLSVCSFIKKQIENEGLPENYCAYKMRFYDTTDPGTRIKILTDGMLLQELKADPTLSKYSVIMVDEAHERSLNIDFILGLLKQIIAVRTELKVIISSATLNTKAFSKYFSNPATHEGAPIISIKARVYDVDVKYFPLKMKGDTNETSHAVCVIINQLLKRFRENGYKDSEDTLVFLPGEFDIKMAMQQIYVECDTEHLQVYPLYGRLNKEEQQLVFEKTEPGRMKVVLATNIAETSLTIDGIRVVIDCGFAKINYYNQTDFTSSLVLRPISRSSAEQRRGRAGRTAPGTCYRLYSKEDYEARILWTPEEILRTDLSEVVLRMVDLGIYDFEKFPYVTKPDSKALASGEKTLRLLDAIDDNRHLTQTGAVMVRYPLLPRHSRCLAESLKRYPEILKPVIICISFLSGRTPFVLPSGEEDMARSAHRHFNSPYGDFVNYQTIYNSYAALESPSKRESFCKANYLDRQSMDEILHITEQLCQITDEIGVPVSECRINDAQTFAHELLVCLGSGLLQYVCAKKKAFVYRTITTDEIYIHPGSAWFRDPPQYILAGEIVMTAKMYARTVSPLRPEWVVNEISPSLSERLKKMVRRKDKERDTDKDSMSGRGGEKTMRLYGLELPVLTETGKKSRRIVVIPVKDLPSLSRSYKKASRHPKSTFAAVLFRDRYLLYGERLHEIAGLSGRYSINEDSYVEKPCRNVFYLDNIKEIIPYLSQIMKISPLREKNRLGFIELLVSGKSGIFFHVNRSFTDALNNTAYALLGILDNEDIPEARKTYNRILKMLD
ncbi:MAG: helicase-related protein [Sphaerochaeta sp.]